MNERGINVPVVLGGAALTRRYVEDDLKSLYKGRLFYARDAFAGLHTMDKLTGGNGREELSGETLKAVAAVTATGEDAEDLVGEEAKLGIHKSLKPRAVAKTTGDTTHTKRSDVSAEVPIPEAPFYGSRVVEDVSLDEVFAFVNETALFKGQWQFKQGRKPADEYQMLVREMVRPVYEELKERSKREQLLVPRVVYGYFPCRSEGNDLVIYHDDKTTERTRFTFPRQPGGKRLCLADFFRSMDSGKIDIVAFHLVTMGRRASQYAQELFKSDNYADYLYFHGLSV